MARARFVPDLDGYRALMRSYAMLGILSGAADSMADAANGSASPDEMDRMPFASKSGTDEVAAFAMAFTNSPHGRNAEARDKDLTKALKSMRAG